MENQKLITPDIKIYELLEKYPMVEDVLISLAPEFRKLKNPILRRTIARVTTLKQAAIVGNLNLSHLLNTLRKAVGQDEAYLKEQEAESVSKPIWLKDENIVIRYNATDDLKQGIHPVNKVVKELETLEKEKIYCLSTEFIPSPLIDIVKGKGYNAYTEKGEDNLFNTYFCEQ